MKRVAALLWILGQLTALGDELEYGYRLAGLFDPERVGDFREFMGENFPGVVVMDVSFETGVVRLRYDPVRLKPFQPVNSPETARQRMSALLREASRGVFDVLPLSEVPSGELVEARIPVQGLDCRGCSYGAYLVMTRSEGVDYAAASFRTGEICVRFDRRKTSVEALEEALAARSIPTDYRISGPDLVPFSEMRVVRCSSEEPASDELYFHSTGLAQNAIDGNPRTKWSSRYAKNEVAPPPHELVIDLGKTRNVAGFRYLPRQLGYNGLPAETEFFVGDSPEDFTGEPVARSVFSARKCVQSADCARPVSGRYVLVRVLSEVRGKPVASIAEVAVVQSP